MLLIDLMARLENSEIRTVENDRGDRMYGYFISEDEMLEIRKNLRDLAKLKKEERP